MEILETILHRRSIRRYTDEEIPEDKLKAVLYAGLAAASSKNRRPWELIVVRDKTMLNQLGGCRPGAERLLNGCNAAIAVTADTELADVWVEDCASAMTQMHLAADALGLGSCWLQVRMRKTPDGSRDAQDVVRELLGIPEKYGVLAILALGMPAELPAPRTVSDLPLEKIHNEHF